MAATLYTVFVGISVALLKEFNSVVSEPYMDEPFHIPQAQAYCRGEFEIWDPKITTPPGLYILSLALKKAFMLKCNVPMLRLTTMLPYLTLPLVLTRLMCFHQRERIPARLLSPTVDALVLSAFPIAWFFGFLYYTEVPSLLFVTGTVVAAMQNQHWFAALLGLISCTFRQTNVVWVLYAYALSQLMYLRFRRAPVGATKPLNQLHDPPALTATFDDVVQSVLSAPKILGDILPAFIPYALVLAFFGAFVVWNGGIVLGDKSNHIPSLHIPQVYYFFAFSTAFGWPALISGEGGIFGLAREVQRRMFGSKIRILSTALACSVMAVTVNLYTIHHPFLLSDNRHYTFYIWHRVYMRYPLPYLLIPIYIACAWAWFLRVGAKQTILQTLILPIFVLPTLLPTPLLEPRYFLIPYILLRSQVADMPTWSLIMEGSWYAAINAATMWIFLYMPREGVGRFMW
ncbi:glucosyltransferase [Mycena alexandri]|uniref:Dol-P-Glc:Glc(2)Man(9)GlcNAc(2)-PP-Dol alpha-1,2-glucosyltransferase n=1 Tax=Mycena alexandri TaxID=1745969 RepID=A0AAD6TA96_9AGAR|nr:glucosyltransferase [Mycena alexandri]